MTTWRGFADALQRRASLRAFVWFATTAKVSATVMIGGKPTAALRTTTTAHDGSVTLGRQTVMIEG